MNIFVTDPSPILSAEALDDKRVNKMILESTQLLCNALRFYGCDENWLYKPTHKNHPCSVWAKENNKNWIWLYDHTGDLFDEFCKIKLREKDHGCYSVWYKLLDHYNYIPKSNFMTPFAQCITPYEGMIDHGNVYDNYKHYMVHKWNNDKRKPTWGNRNLPNWLVQTKDGVFMVRDT